MRRYVLGAILLALGASLFAQNQAADAESIYVRTMPIIKIYTHQLGYKVYYLTDSGKTASFYAPVEWFNQAGGKGSMIYGLGAQYPYLSVYWVDRKFSHVKLYVIESMLSDTWGVLKEPPSQIADKFKVEELELE